MPNKNITKTKTCTAWYVNLVSGASSAIVNEGLSPVSNDYSLIAGTVTPGYRSFKNKFYLPNLNYSKKVSLMTDHLAYSILDDGPGGKYMRYWDRTCQKEGYPVTPDITCDDPVPLVNKRMLESLNTANADTLTTLAELNRTSSMVTSAASSIANALRQLRRGQLSGAMSSLGVLVSGRQNNRYKKRFDEARSRPREPNGRDPVQDLVANTWLNYSYGWKPLLGDVYSHCEALANALVDHNNVVRVMRKSAATHGEKINVVRYGGKVTLVMSKIQKIDRTANMVLYYSKADNPLNPLLHFGIQNPLTVAWEVVPFSFVVDWFLPVGEYLSSLTATAGLNFVKGTVSERTTISVVADVQPGPTIPNGSPQTFQSISGGGKYTYKSFEYIRTIMNTFPSPQLPQLRDPRSLTRALSAISLLVTMRPK